MPYDPTAARSSADFSTNSTYQGAWLCYINGIEVPIVGFNVTSGVWQIPQFTINLVPDILLMRLGHEDRVQVAIFYLDSWYNPDKPEFRLLVDGEIIGWSFQQVAGQRTMSFDCMAHIHVFQQLYFFFMTNVEDLVTAQSPEIAAQGVAMPAGLTYPYALFHQGLSVPPGETRSIRFPNLPPEPGTAGAPVPGSGAPTSAVPTDDNTTGDQASAAPIKAPYELVYNVIKGVISKEVPNEKRAIPMMNFFARHIRKTRLQNRFVRLPILEDPETLTERSGVFPIFEAARNTEALFALQRTMASQISNAGPIWNMLYQVLNMVYMRIGMITNPACVMTDLDGKILRAFTATEEIVDQTAVGVIARAEREATAAAVAATPPPTTPTAITGQSLANNIADSYRAYLRSFYPNIQIENINLNEPGHQTPVELIDLLDRRFQSINPHNSQSEPGSPADRQWRLQYRQGLESLRQRTAAQYHDGLSSPFNQLASRRAEQQRQQSQATADTQSATARQAAETQRQSHLAQVRAEAIQGGEGHSHGTNPRTPIRLAQYFVQPEFLFGIPPHCNVFFPSMIKNWSMSENYLNQPTRIYVNDSVMSRLLRPSTAAHRELMIHALTVGYPEEADAIMHHSGEARAANRSAVQTQETGKNLLIWPEEYFKGPVTARLELPAWFQMLRQFMNNSGATPPATVGTAPAVAPEPVSGGAPADAGGWVTGAAREGDASFVPHFLPSRRSTAVRNLPSMEPFFLPNSSMGTGLYLRHRRGFDEKNFLQRGSNSDPANYLPPADTRIHPGNRSTRAACTTKLLKDVVRPMVSGFNEGQLSAIAFGLFWLQCHEGDDDGMMKNWSFGNMRMFTRWYGPPDLSDHWTVNPFDRLNYDAHLSARVGAEFFVRRLVQSRRYNSAFEAMVRGHPSPRVQGYVNRLYQEQPHLAQVFDPVAPVNPVVYYFALAELGYMATGSSSDLRLANAYRRSRNYQGQTFEQKYLEVIHDLPSAPNPVEVVSVMTGVPPPYPPAEERRIFPAGTGGAGRSAAQIRVIHNSPPPTGATAQPGTGTGTAPTTTTTAIGSTESSPQEANEGNQFSVLFRVYAQYEYYRQRYGQRQGGVNLAFNPYVVPGFPCVVFDSMRTRFHAVGYVQTVTHTGMVSGGQGSLETTVGMSSIRAFYEFLRDVRTDSERFIATLGSAPADPIPQIMGVIQDDVNAEKFYRKFFHGDLNKGNRAAFKFNEIMGYSQGIEVEAIHVEGRAISTVVDEEQRAQRTTPNDTGAVPSTATTTTANSSSTAQLTNNINPNLELSPIPGPYSRAFDSYDSAMQINARPVCTLQQYIRFLHGGKTITSLMSTGDVQGELFEFSYVAVSEEGPTVNVSPDRRETVSRGTTTRKPATYYARIFRLRQGPGTFPGEHERGYTDPPTIQPTTSLAGVAANFPQTRADWDTALKNYATKVRVLIHPT